MGHAVAIYFFGWGGRIRTYECGNQNPVPYRLATPQRQAKPFKIKINGAGDKFRTCYLQSHNLALSRLSYARRNGAPGETRTPDTRLRRPLLYPAELRARKHFCCALKP